jgi:hypothetical protein
MARFVRFAVIFIATLTLGSVGAYAQTSPASPGTESKFAAEFAAAATLGHNSSSSFGAEFDYRLMQDYDLFVETGRMRNVTTSDADARANRIAAQVGGTAHPIQKATYFDVGVRYRTLLWSEPWHPYVALGLGVAAVNTHTTLVNTDPESTVSLGPDLAGTVTKPFLMIGFGVRRPFHGRYFVDGSYRYGRIFARTGVIDGDVGSNTQRVQVGVGMRF